MPDSSSLTSPPLQTPLERGQRILRAVRRRWIPALAVLLLTVAVAVAYTAHKQATYASSAEILIQQPDAVQGAINPGSISSPADATRDVTTYTQMVTSDSVTAAVRQALGVNMTLAALKGEITVAGQDTSDLVSITATDTSAARAARIANAFATQYQAYRRATAVAAIQAALHSAQVAGGAQRTPVAITVRIQALQAAAASETGGVELIRAASPALTPVSHRTMTAVAAGFVGLVLAALVVLALELIDRRLCDEGEFEAAFDAPVVATLTRSRRGARQDAAIRARRRDVADLAARLCYGHGDVAQPTVVIAPATSDDSARDVAAQLSAELSALGRNVMVIDAELETSRPGMPEPPTSGGLSAILTARSVLADELTVTQLIGPEGSSGHARATPDAWLAVAAGPPVPRPEALLRQDALRGVFSQAHQFADFIVVVGPSLERPGALLPVARQANGLLVLARPRSLTPRRAGQLAEMLAAAHLDVTGIIVDEEPRRGRTERVGYLTTSGMIDVREFAAWRQAATVTDDGERPAAVNGAGAGRAVSGSGANGSGTA
jgi:capsular polysaccharide biosynthesis protein